MQAKNYQGHNGGDNLLKNAKTDLAKDTFKKA